MFDVGLYLGGGSREVDVRDLLISDYRSTPSNNLWEDTWMGLTSYTIGQYVKPTVANANGHFYRCTQTGTSAASASEPQWPTTYNTEINDADVNWMEIGQSIGIFNGLTQQTSIRNCRLEPVLVAFANSSNGNTILDSCRLVGEPMAYLNVGTAGNSPVFATNCLFAGEIELGGGGGSVQTKFIGINNTVTPATTAGSLSQQVPDHFGGVFTYNNIFQIPYIKFPVYPVASPDPNTLDYYGEGTWTPVIKGTTGDGEYTLDSIANYTKIGRLVNIQANITITTVASGYGNLEIVGVPFARKENSIFCGTVATSGVDLPDGTVFLTLLEGNPTLSEGRMYISATIDGGEEIVLTTTSLSPVSRIRLNLTYIT